MGHIIRGEDKKTALLIATEKEQTSVVELLLQSSALSDIQDSMEYTILYLLIQNGHEAIVGRRLDDAQLEPGNPNG